MNIVYICKKKKVNLKPHMCVHALCMTLKTG